VEEIMVTLESLDNVVNQIKEKMDKIQEWLGEPLSTYESVCNDCQQDKDLCPDCDMGDKYLSPDQIDHRENR
jgi:hypothetical protein